MNIGDSGIEITIELMCRESFGDSAQVSILQLPIYTPNAFRLLLLSLNWHAALEKWKTWKTWKLYYNCLAKQ